VRSSSSPGSRGASRRIAIRPNTAGFGRTGLKHAVRSARPQSRKKRVCSYPGHLSHTPYDLLRIGAWALVIVGGLLVVTGLIRYWALARGPNP
jgi:hypothetical protein